jgi:hypothetical protein
MFIKNSFFAPPQKKGQDDGFGGVGIPKYSIAGIAKDYMNRSLSNKRKSSSQINVDLSKTHHSRGFSKGAEFSDVKSN